MKVASSSPRRPKALRTTPASSLVPPLRAKMPRPSSRKLGGRGWVISGARAARVAADDDGVGVVPAVAPAPDGGPAQHHEGGDLVEGFGHPAGLERRAVARL